MSSRGGKPSVPKFSSFKPKSEEAAAPPPAASSSSSKEKAEKPEKAARVDHGRTGGSGGDDGSNSNNGASRRHRSPRRGAPSPSSSSSAAHRPRGPADRDSRGGREAEVPRRPAAPSRHGGGGGGGGELFVIDKRGDALIRRYGGNSRYDVPSYRRYGSGRLLGGDGFFRIDRSGSRDEFVLRGFGESGGSALGRDRKSVLARTGRRATELVRIRPDESRTFSGTEDFLPLRQSRKRKRGHSQSDESGGEDGPSYRSIHGMSKKHEHSDSDEAYGSDASMESGQQDSNDPIKARNIELSRKVRDQPEDIDAWLELVDQQDVLLSMGEQDGRRATQAEIRSYADIKLSMLEKALGHAKAPEQIERLRLRRITEGAKIWDPKTTAQRWEELLKDYGTSFEIWRSYTNFRQTSLQTFRYDDIKQLYVDRIRLIEKELAGISPASGKQGWYEQLIVVFLRATRFIADAGYSELATAAWQATLELNFYRPTSLAGAPQEAALSSLQSFWESEVSRIGDESAKGWAHFEDTGGVDEAPEPKTFQDAPLPTTRDGYRAWASVEAQRARDAKVPARTMDDGTEDDPYRVVMFADIQDLLTHIPSEDLPMIRNLLVDAFLIFCQLPPALGTSDALQLILRDGVAGGGAIVPLDLDSDQNKRDLSSQDMSDGVIKLPEFAHQYQKMAKSTDVLFPARHWFRYMNPIRETVQPEQYQLISHTLKQLTSCIGNEELATYYLSFDYLNNTDSTKKTAKALLKRNPTNIELYIGFANSEFIKGNKDAARNVVSAALGLPALPLHDRLRLCIAWAWMELEDGQVAQALLRLCRASEDGDLGDSASPASILKTRQMLTGNRDHLVSSGDPDGALVFAEGLGLLEYMTRTSSKEPQSAAQGDIWSAIATVSPASEDLVARGFAESLAHEKLLQFAAQLLYYHASHGPYRPAFFREHIGRFVERFPDNTMFLSLYAWREERLSIDDRVRALLGRTVLTRARDRPSSRIFAIRHEMATGNAHSTRAAFERAVEAADDDGGGGNSSRHHVGVWASYVRYCHARRELRPRAREVFYRAVQRCPWSKDVFLEAFATLVRDMDSTELRSVYSTLCDKGLRVHVELGEFAEQWKERARARRG